MTEEKPNIVVLEGKKYNLDKLSDEDIFKLKEYIEKKYEILAKKIDKIANKF